MKTVTQLNPRKCRATNSSGIQCGNKPIPFSRYCKDHQDKIRWRDYWLGVLSAVIIGFVYFYFSASKSEQLNQSEHLVRIESGQDTARTQLKSLNDLLENHIENIDTVMSSLNRDYIKKDLKLLESLIMI